LRYDAAIIGAGAEGLAAAIILARAGVRAIVIECGERAGGRFLTREFHPGFRACPFADDAAEIPAELYWALDLARHGAVLAPRRCSVALWPDRSHVLALRDNAQSGALLAKSADFRRSIVARVLAESKTREARSLFRRRSVGAPWPGSVWATSAMADVLGEDDAGAHLAAFALSGRAADPFQAGSALNFLTAGSGGGRLSGTLGRLGEALYASAQAAGVEFSFGLEASDIHRRDGRIVGVGLADGSAIATRSVVSTLDLKRTFLTFFSWNALPGPVMGRVNGFRLAGSTARVLFALARAPEFALAEAAAGAIHVAPSLDRFGEAFHAWRSGIVSAHVPVTLNVISHGNPGLAPSGAAVVTATLGAVPFRLFDGAWTHEKRELLRARALEAAESVSPGFGARVTGSEVVAPPDIEDALGATDGDLLGGELAGDQMLGSGPWNKPALPRTPISGLYLAGSNLTASAFATCVAGAAAAAALLSDRAEGRIK